MKKILFVASLLSVLLLSSCVKAEYDMFGTISGTVIDISSGNQGDPMSNVLVTLSPTLKNTYTGKDGQFEYRDLDAGKYTVTVQSEGYQANRKEVNVNAGETTTISLVMEKKL